MTAKSLMRPDIKAGPILRGLSPAKTWPGPADSSCGGRESETGVSAAPSPAAAAAAMHHHHHEIVFM